MDKKFETNNIPILSKKTVSDERGERDVTVD
jgi:hypothetical protein